jgi:hypothetical protein
MQTEKNIKKQRRNLISLKLTKVDYPKISRIVLNEEEKKKLKELFNIMSTASNILLWNDLRRRCKKKYSSKLIGILDGSGLISKTLKK